MSRAERLSARIWAERCRLELARALIARGPHGRAERLLQSNAAAADALGCRSIARDAAELLAGAVGRDVARL